MPYKGLDTTRTFILLAELEESSALAIVGLRSLKSLKYAPEESAAILTLLSISSEKMLKVGAGLAALDKGRPWPPRSQMKIWGHNLRLLNDNALSAYQEGLSHSTAPGYLRDLLEKSRSDKLMKTLLGILSNWGERARFHRLDELAGQPQAGPSPLELWQELEDLALESRPSLRLALGTPGALDAAIQYTNSELASSFLLWWESHTRAWMTGTIGPDAKASSSILFRLLDEQRKSDP